MATSAEQAMADHNGIRTADVGKAAIPRDLTSFEAFWPWYMREHSNRLNRRLHFVGTTLALSLLASAVLLGQPWLLLALPVAGYGFAWAGHYLVEKNRPATFIYWWWSLRGDFRMYGHMWRGRGW